MDRLKYLNEILMNNFKNFLKITDDVEISENLEVSHNSNEENIEFSKNKNLKVDHDETRAQKRQAVLLTSSCEKLKMSATSKTEF